MQGTCCHEISTKLSSLEFDLNVLEASLSIQRHMYFNPTE